MVFEQIQVKVWVMTARKGPKVPQEKVKHLAEPYGPWSFFFKGCWVFTLAPGFLTQLHLKLIYLTMQIY